VRGSLRVIAATEEELGAHERVLQLIDTVSRGKTLWRKEEPATTLAATC